MTDFFSAPRNSKMEIGEIYFWTDTIKDWKKLLDLDKYKFIMMNIRNYTGD